MDDEYDITDLRQYINGRPVLINPPPPNYYDMLILPSDCAHNSTTLAAAASNATSSGLIGLEHQNTGSGGMISGDYNTNNNGRWPRQETLTLLEVRSRLDYKFKEANLKGPLWDEVSRIMSEEYGYQRSGKKCREKFENLYKYYKKTKDQGKGTSRQDHGKRYRFFRQLEAIYGESSNNNNNSASISEAAHLNIGGNFQYNYANYNNNGAAPSSANNNNASTSSGYNDTTSSDHHHTMDDGFPKRGAVEKRIWKAKVEELISEQMTRLIEKQEDWMEKMMITIENREKERTMREEQWRRDNMERIEREHKYWAGERAWIEARDDALVNAFERFTGKELKLPHKEQMMCMRIDESGTDKRRKEVNVSRSSRMLDPSSHVDAITKQGGEVGSCDMNMNQQGGVGHTISLNIDGNNSLSANNDAVNDGSFRFFTWDGYGRYMN